MHILAVIPAYNEEECLARTVSHLVETCPDIDYLVVNDGSRDGTSRIISKERIHGVTLPVNSGLTSAFKTGMKYAQRHGYDAVVQFDADGQHLPEYIPAMSALLEENAADIVIASRYLDGSVKPSGLRGVGSRLISTLLKLTAGLNVTDPTSGMRMYGKTMIDSFATGFDVAPEPDMLAQAAHRGMKVKEIPCKMLDRQGGTSYLKLGNAVAYMARTTLSILLTAVLR